MAALTSTDVTVAVLKKEIAGRRRVNTFSIAFGNGALTYPTGGVPLPAKTSFGMLLGVFDFMDLEQAYANGYVYKYDRTNHKLVMYYADYDAAADGPLIQVANSVAPAAATLYGKAQGGLTHA